MSEGFFDVTEEDLVEVPKAERWFFKDWADLQVEIEEFEMKDNGMGLKCKVLSEVDNGVVVDDHVGKTFYCNVSNKSKFRGALMLCFWDKDQLLRGEHKLDGARSVIAGSKIGMTATPPSVSEKNGKTYQNYINFKKLTVDSVPF